MTLLMAAAILAASTVVEESWQILVVAIGLVVLPTTWYHEVKNRPRPTWPADFTASQRQATERAIRGRLMPVDPAVRAEAVRRLRAWRIRTTNGWVFVGILTVLGLGSVFLAVHVSVWCWIDVGCCLVLAAWTAVELHLGTRALERLERGEVPARTGGERAR